MQFAKKINEHAQRLYEVLIIHLIIKKKTIYKTN